MASTAGIFFAGVVTTSVILGAGFGGGLLMANTALKDSPNYQARVAPPAALSPVRVILPSTAEAAQPPQPPVQQAAVTPDRGSPPPQLQPAVEPQASADKQIERADAKKAEVEAKERRKRYAERKAKRQAAERARRQQQELAQGERRDAPVMAFGADEPASRPFSLFGNN